MQEVSVDTTDKKILGELIRDARKPVSQIAKKIRLSRQMVTRRIEEMVKNGTIKCFASTINYEKLGMQHAEVWLRIRDFTGKLREQLLEHLIEHPYTRWVGETLGTYNIRVTFISANHTHLEVLLSEFFEHWGSHVDDYELSVIVGVSKHHSTQLTTGEWKKLERIMEVEPDPDIDEKDIAIMQLLCEDARISYMDISKQVDLSLEGVRQRIKRIEKDNLIIHYSAKVQNEHLNRQWVILSVRFSNLDDDLKTAIAEFTRSKNFGANSYFLLGSWHYHITINANSMNDLQEAFQYFYQTFSEHIRDVQTAHVTASHKYPGYPKGMFDILQERLKKR